MERLTKPIIGCFKYGLSNFEHKPKEFADYDAFYAYNMAVKRLGEYEDTGLTPEEINGFKHLEVILHTAIDKLTENVKSEAIKEFADRLKEYELYMFYSFPNKRNLGSEGYIVLSDSIDNLVKEMTED